MYTGFLHLHKTVVIIFLLLYVIKLILLLIGKTDALTTFTKKFKVLDILVSALFLITGIYLAIYSGSTNAGSWMWVKLVAVFLSIPLAVIGFKKLKKAPAILSVVLLVYAYGVSETKSPRMKKADYYAALNKGDEGAADLKSFNPNADNYDITAHGKSIYTAYCVACHGNDGKAAISGAKDITISQLSKDEIMLKIRKGKNGMPAFGESVLSDEEVFAVTSYVLTNIMAAPSANH